MKIGICRLPDGLSPEDAAWHDLAQRIERERPDIALLNEMPFGPWIASDPRFDGDVADASVRIHEASLPSLFALPTAVISSRPIHGPRRLANEAFLAAGGRCQPIHHKQYFPQEDGFFESTWFRAERPGFDVVEYGGLRIGVLLCTELMFTEWARHYRRQGAHVIVSPRASGASMRCWTAAAQMAAIVSGCYVLSSNRVSDGFDRGPHFGGCGFAYAPTGDLLCETAESTPFRCVDIDLRLVTEAQSRYPCYLRELSNVQADYFAGLAIARHSISNSTGT